MDSKNDSHDAAMMGMGMGMGTRRKRSTDPKVIKEKERLAETMFTVRKEMGMIPPVFLLFLKYFW